jgi:hypothetical protein
MQFICLGGGGAKDLLLGIGGEWELDFHGLSTVVWK